jgi:RNA polymerase subunit RPABC4/transcription elongation factor Spt4
MIEDNSTICPACGMRYIFTHYKDRCPVCCPVDEPDESDDYVLVDEVYDDDD